MKTTININGLDVEFTDQTPTRPCAVYALSHKFPSDPQLVECFVFIGEMCVAIDGHAKVLSSLSGWKWSAPLVPVTEVEKAWNEGWTQCDYADCPSIKRGDEWLASNSRKVVEGVQ